MNANCISIKSESQPSFLIGKSIHIVYGIELFCLWDITPHCSFTQLFYLTVKLANAIFDMKLYVPGSVAAIAKL
jgi:hypothetical protein